MLMLKQFRQVRNCQANSTDTFNDARTRSDVNIDLIAITGCDGGGVTAERDRRQSFAHELVVQIKHPKPVKCVVTDIQTDSDFIIK